MYELDDSQLAKLRELAEPSEAFAAWWRGQGNHWSLDELASRASAPGADPWVKLQAQFAAVLQDAFEAGRQSAREL